jgi:hypothetical protein
MRECAITKVREAYAVRGDEGVDSEAALNYLAAKFWV